MTLRIRSAVPDDAPRLAALVRALNTHEREPVEHFDEAVARRDGFGENRRYETLLAELHRKVVGYALFHAAYDTAWAATGVYLIDIFVEPEARRRGIGRRLAAAVAAAAKERGASFLWWCSKPWNDEAHGFYRALGAIEEPVIAHAVVFEKFERLAAEATRG
jgi:ribosomal protein S18 acetylase RimI-like enzyme